MLISMWGVLLGGLLTLLGGVVSARWIVPWAATYQRAQQRWEDDLVALDDLLAWEIDEAVEDLVSTWNDLKGELEARESRRSEGSSQAEARNSVISQKQDAFEHAMDVWERLAGSRLELLARHVEHRHTSWGERSVLVASVRHYRKTFSPITSTWNTDSIECVDSELAQEKTQRKQILADVRKQGAHLWPSSEPFSKRLRSRFRSKAFGSDTE